MIKLYPNKKYSILYAKGKVHSYGDTIEFETLDTIPEAKHLIQVRDISTGEIIDLTDLLAHPWLDIHEIRN